MRNVGLFISVILTSFSGLGSLFAKTKGAPSADTEKALKNWTSAEREVCKSIVDFADIQDLSAQEIYDYQLLLELMSQVSDQPIDYCENLLMANMVFSKPPKQLQ